MKHDSLDPISIQPVVVKFNTSGSHRLRACEHGEHVDYVMFIYIHIIVPYLGMV
jgi:hypothetical protein